mmetsp:Transcript_36484/g.67172  ORF Transcript_36484/g.67172 Transcript_36484/m.67172 type:complete len:426 (+) Transcript_36484:115-1392(+)
MWLQTPWKSLLVLLGVFLEAVAECGFEYGFNYMHHGQDWQKGECGSRERQSPIDFDTNALQLTVSETSFNFEYERVKIRFTLQNNGHSLAANLIGKGFGGITLHGQWFNLLSVNFHAQSEHTFRGEHMPLELHLVHREAETNHILVVAIPFTAPSRIGAALVQAAPQAGPRFVIASGLRGPAKPKPGDLGFNPTLQRFLTYPLPSGGASAEVELPSAVDIITPLVANGVFFHYSGSLTVPPCAEQVTWLVRRDPLMASASQAELIRKNIMQATQNSGNWRSTMPLMGRIITLMSAKEGFPKSMPDLPPALNMNLPGADFGAVEQAKDAIEQARILQSMGRALSGDLAEGSSEVIEALPEPQEKAIYKTEQAVRKGRKEQIPTPDPEVQLRRIQESVTDQMNDALWAAWVAEQEAVKVRASPLALS